MKIANQPGHVTGSPKTLAADVAAQTSIPGISAWFGTELAPAARAAVLATAAGKGWTVTHDGGPGKGECAILTKNAHYTKILETGWFQLTEGGGKARLAHPIVAPYVVAENLSGHVVLLTNAHLPAHIEGIWARLPLPMRTKFRAVQKHPRLSPAIATWLEAVRSWRRQVNRKASEHKVDDIVVATDGNMDANKLWVRELIKDVWPDLELAYTKQPDLGRRTVGWLLTSMTPGHRHVVKSKGSDHDCGIYELTHINKTPVKVKPASPPDPFELCTYAGHRMDQKTKTFIQCLEKDLPDLAPLTVEQGCYNAGGVAASAGTHDGGGVFDLAPFEHGRKILAAKKRGAFVWYRPFNWDGRGGSEHIHCGIRNEGKLSPSAARQQVQYDAHPPTNGLANFGIDPTWHPNPPVAFSYLAAWHEVNG